MLLPYILCVIHKCHVLSIRLLTISKIEILSKVKKIKNCSLKVMVKSLFIIVWADALKEDLRFTAPIQFNYSENRLLIKG